MRIATTVAALAILSLPATALAATTMNITPNGSINNPPTTVDRPCYHGPFWPDCGGPAAAGVPAGRPAA